MLNQVQLIGFTGAEAEIRTTTKGKKFATLRVATSRYTKKGDDKTTYTTWHTIEVWSPRTIAWLAGKGLPKGSKVFVQGEIRNEQYTDKDNVERYFTKVSISSPGHELKSLDKPEQNPADED